MRYIKLFESFNGIISEDLQYHIDNKMSITENVFRPGSDKYFDLIKEARQLFDNNQIELSELDTELYESTDIGRFGEYEGQIVPLDLPMETIEEGLSPQVTSDNVFSIHDRKEGDLIKVEGEYVKYIKPKSWIKDKNANCTEFSAEFNGKEISIKYDDGYDAYVFESLYKGREVKLNYPMRGGTKKYHVYVKNPKTGKVKKIAFGDVHGGLTAKVSDPKARKAFAARHNCDMKKDKTKAGYWACRVNKYGHLWGGKTYPGYW